jgi:hypothetical protein
MEKSKFVIQLMNIPLDAAQFDGEEIAEWRISGVNGFIYILSKLPLTPNQTKISRGSFSDNELLGVFLSLHLKKHGFTGFGISGFGGGGSLQAFTWAVYESRQTPTYYVKNWKFS